MATPTALAVAELHGEVMGSRLHIVVTGDSGDHEALAQEARRELEDLEQRWSRFIPTSEVSALHRHAGESVRVSEETFELVSRAAEASRRTNGIFDPMMLRAIEDCGYDRTFASIEAGVARMLSEARHDSETPAAAPSCELITFDREHRTIRLPAGGGFDPGGLGKGLAADLVSATIIAAGASGAMVNVGGDLRCRGVGPTGNGWAIAAGDHIAGVGGVVLDVADGGVATSTSKRRTWTTSTGRAHHLLNPATGQPSTMAADVVTVVAATACDAETLATALAVVGNVPPETSMLGEAGAIIHHADGRRSTLGPIEEYLR